MFDILGIGMNKVDARGAIQEMMCGATRGLLEGYEYRLEEKDNEIRRLREKLQETEDWKKRYEELHDVMQSMDKSKKKKR